MSWHLPDPYFFLSLLAILAAFLAIVYEIYEGIRKFRKRRQAFLLGGPEEAPDHKLLLARHQRLHHQAEVLVDLANGTAVDSPSPPKYPPSPRNYLKKAKPLDGLQRDRRIDPELPHQEAQREFLHRLLQGGSSTGSS